MLVSTKSVMKATALVMVLASVAACTSKPKPTVETATPVAQTTPTQTPSNAPSNVTQGPITAGLVPGSQQDFVVNVGDRVYFDTDQSSIRADAQDILSAQAAWLNRYPAVKIRIEGNADERGTREYNFALGARRAQAISDFLTGKGVVPARIATISYGKESPIDNGDGEDAWAHNRNGHTTLTSGTK